MQRDPRAFLWDVKKSATQIQAFIDGMDAPAYAANVMAQAAVERKFEIIGEALNQLTKLDAGLAARISDLPKIVAFRNQLIHGYACRNACGQSTERKGTRAMAEAAKTREKPLMLSPKALEKALASSGLRARRLAEAFGQKVPGIAVKPEASATKSARKKLAS